MIFNALALTLTLLASTTLATPTSLDKRYSVTCGDNGGGYVSVSEAQSCVNYLYAKGTTACTVNGENTVFCTAGSTKIYGSNINLVNNPSSYCRDVAAGAQAIIDGCTQGGTVAGSNAAAGNGDIIVSINH
ncbi:hypothetical protein BDW59DRAFT_163544 [Aspergillus cavernicola]|uniref:Uncharacterized protein n=1 Tax=Aspergillus cavernicola TaxID=176166 RepID=A0ABR4I684_9EURO